VDIPNEDRERWFACSERMPPIGQPVLCWSTELTYIVESYDGAGWGNEAEGYIGPDAEPEFWCFIPGPSPEDNRWSEGATG